MDALPPTHPAKQMVRRASTGQLVASTELRAADAAAAGSGAARTSSSTSPGGYDMAQTRPPPSAKRVSWRDGTAGEKLCSSLRFCWTDAPRACSKDADVRLAYASAQALQPAAAAVATPATSLSSSFGALCGRCKQTPALT